MSLANKPRLLNPQPHAGKDIELIVGIDVGTTFSGVCYAFLRPEEVPEIWSVERFSDQTNGDHKVPSIAYYDEDSNLRAAGATAVSNNIVEEAECEGWFKAEYFKMHMRPADMKVDTRGLNLSPLPPSMTVVAVMADFLRYLYSETIKYIEERHTDSDTLLKRVSSRTRFVLSHPNGWTGLPQQRMREAAVLGGLIENNEAGRAKVTFVSEGEASALSCLAGGLCPPDLQPGYRFMIADLGGGTLDITSYEIVRSSPPQLKELTRSDCQFAGSVFVNRKARQLLQRKLRGSQYDNPEILDDAINEYFENNTKRQFKDATRVSWLRIGERGENNAKLGIRRGSLRLDGMELASSQIKACGGKPMPVWLVGGFSASPWLLKKLKEELESDDISVKRPEIDVAKAVAHGNLLFALEHPVISRMTRATYGIRCATLYDMHSAEHHRRRHLKYTDLEGDEVIPGTFDAIVNKNVEVNEIQELSRSYSRLVKNSQTAVFEVTLLSFDHDVDPPYWYDEDKTKFRMACRVKADLSALCRLSTLRTHNGKKFWRLDYSCEIMFGSTELQARIKWDENGETKYGPVTIFYEE